MNERALTRKALLAGGAAGAAALAAASTGSAQGKEERDIVGSWFATVTFEDSGSSSVDELFAFHPGGIVTIAHRLYRPSTPFGPLLETAGLGAWKRLAGNGYSASIRFLLQQAPPSAGAPVGTEFARLEVRMDRAGARLVGRLESSIKDRWGTETKSVAGAVVGERIVA